MNDRYRVHAKSTFRHYMSFFMDKVHTHVTSSDNRAEWDDIIDNIMDGVKAEIKEENTQAMVDAASWPEFANMLAAVDTEAIETIKVLQRDNQRMRKELQTYIKWWDDNPNGFTLLSVMKHTKELLGEIYAE